jgi:Holliday junction DNA helicase RuvA
MIARLRGTLLVKKPGHAVVDVSGVGYKVLIPLSTYYELGEEGSSVDFRVYTHVREDALALFGFLSELEEALFKRLIGVSGVGPALGLKILSGLEVLDLIEALRRGDLARLAGIPGVGKKTAERLVVELKDKMPELLSEAGTPGRPAPPPETALRDDVLSALLNLGYNRGAAEKTLQQILREDKDSSFEALLKAALRGLSR